MTTFVSTRYLPKDTERFIFANGSARVHAESVCEPEFPCVIHRHSGHEGSDLPMHLSERGLVSHVDDDGLHPCPDSLAYFRRLYPERTQTGIRCPECSEEIYSNSRHDFVSCKCRDSFVDGGFDYLRYGGLVAAKIEQVTREVDRALLPSYFREEAGS